MLCDAPMCDLPFTSTLTSLFLSENPEIFYFDLDILEAKSLTLNINRINNFDLDIERSKSFILDMNQVDNFDLDIEQSKSFIQIR